MHMHLKECGKTCLTALLLTLFLFLWNLSWAEDLSGRVVNIRGGKLERLTAGKWKELNKDSRVSFGDRLRTDKTALAVAELPKVGRFVIGPDSEIELGKSDKNFRADMGRGEVWMRSDLTKGSSAAISTSIATAGIRGTKFSVLFYNDKDLCICTCVGDVSATLKDGKVIQVSTGTIYAMSRNKQAPDKAEPSLPLLEKKGKGFDFCFNCHLEGGSGKLKQDWE